LKKLLNNKLWANLNFVVGDITYNVHREIVILRCPDIEDIVKTDALNSCSKIIFDIILDYIYTDIINLTRSLTWDQLCDLAYYSQILNLKILHLKVIRFIIVNKMPDKNFYALFIRFIRYSPNKFNQAIEYMTPVIAAQAQIHQENIENLIVEFPLIATNILYTLLQEYEFVDINIPADESTYISEMLQLFCGKSCSFDFQVGDIGCHKAILASRCEFFNAMLSSSMIETRQSKADTVLLEGNALGCFIQYLYTGESDHIKDIWDAVEILDAMEYYFFG